MNGIDLIRPIAVHLLRFLFCVKEKKCKKVGLFCHRLIRLCPSIAEYPYVTSIWLHSIYLYMHVVNSMVPS